MQWVKMKKIASIINQLRPLELFIITLFLLGACAILFYTINDPLMDLKGFVFALFAIIISYCDAKYRIIPEVLLIPIILVGLIHVTWLSLAGAAISLLMLIITLVSKREAFGGGDIKLLAAYGFVLGYNGTILGILFGFILFLIRYIYPFIMKKKSTYSLAPCLSIGCFFAFILI